MRRIQDVATIGDGVAIKLSGIPNAGMGLFTTRSFKKGALITEYDGTVISHETALALRRQHLDSHVRSLNSMHLYIDGIRQPEPGRGGASFANDARNPRQNNAVFATRFDSQLARDRVFLKAKEDIPSGAEVFVGYGNTYWDIRDVPPLVLCNPDPQQQHPTSPPAGAQAAAAAAAAADKQLIPPSEYDFPSDHDTNSSEDGDSCSLKDIELDGAASERPSTPPTASKGTPAHTTPSSRLQESPAAAAVSVPRGQKLLFGSPKQPIAGSSVRRSQPMQASQDEAGVQQQQQVLQPAVPAVPAAAAAGAVLTSRPASAPALNAAGVTIGSMLGTPSDSPAQAVIKLQQVRQSPRNALARAAVGAGRKPSSARAARSSQVQEAPLACSNALPYASSSEPQLDLDAFQRMSMTTRDPSAEPVPHTTSPAVTPADAAAGVAAAAAAHMALQQWLNLAGPGALAPRAVPGSVPGSRSARTPSKSPAKGSSSSPKPQQHNRHSPLQLQHEQQQHQAPIFASSLSRQQLRAPQPACSPSKRRLSEQCSPAVGTGSSRKQLHAGSAGLRQPSTDMLQVAEDDSDQDGDYSPSKKAIKTLQLQQQSPGWEVHRAQRMRRAPDPLIEYDGTRQASTPIKKCWW